MLTITKPVRATSASSGSANIFVVDDGDGPGVTTTRRLFRWGLDVEHFRSGDDFFAADHPQRTGCVLVLASGECSASLTLLQRVLAAADRLSVVVLVEQADIRFAVLAIKAGAFDVLPMTSDGDLLRSSLQNALDSRARARSHASDAPRISRPVAIAAIDTLTIRQKDVLARIMLGHPNKNIAADLGISQRTAENHRAVIMKKLGASSISKLVQIAVAAA